MFKALKRWWKYAGAKVNSLFNEHADPKVQIEQAIQEAQKQHALLRGQAASVIGNQKQTEMKLDRAIKEQEKIGANVRQALLMAEEAEAKGDTERANSLTASAEALANRLISIDQQVADLGQLALQTAHSSDQAKDAVEQNKLMLERKLAEKSKLLSQLDQAKMQETVNKAMASLSETTGQDVPTFDEVRDRIESRYAKAKGMSELTETSVEANMLEIEQAAANNEAKGRLAQIRAQLGLPEKTEAAQVTATATATPEPEPAAKETTHGV